MSAPKGWTVRHAITTCVACHGTGDAYNPFEGTWSSLACWCCKGAGETRDVDAIEPQRLVFRDTRTGLALGRVA